MGSLKERVDDFVASERQWERVHRILYARSQMRKASDPDIIAFWREVLDRYKFKEYRQ